jgi:signal transduction histidine kinase
MGAAMAERILIVDDDDLIQTLAKTALEGAGFRADACGTVQEALELVRQDPPDLLILDIKLPDGSGKDVCREFRKSGNDAPVLFLTAFRDLNTRLECFNLGAQDYLQKPFSIEELLARVNVHLGIKKSHDDLMRKNYELELRGRLRQDLTDMLVHDLRAPLTSIHGTLELIKMRGLISDGDYSRLLDCAGTAAEFMILMLNDLLDISQAEQARLEPQVEDVDVTQLCAKLQEIFATKCKRLSKPLEVRPCGALSVRSDPSLLFRILVNLVSNALGMTRQGTSVEVECSQGPSGLRFTVMDRGPGVPDSEKARIFQKFVTKREPGNAFEKVGCGIGLTFCRLAADALKARLWVEDREGGGSRFVFET